MPGFVAAVWLWLQVCTTALNTATPESYLLDKEFNTQYDSSFTEGPLHEMKAHCPQDLDGGELSAWTVATFFPVRMNAGAYVCACIRM